jgi:hypothetical protein
VGNPQLDLFGVKPALRQGPVSDFTGGPLSADEATRVVSGRTLGCVGVLFHKKRTVLCRACHEALIDGTDRFVPLQFEGHGYLAVVYGCEGRKPNVERACELCTDPVRGEVAGLP